MSQRIGRRVRKCRHPGHACCGGLLGTEFFHAGAFGPSISLKKYAGKEGSDFANMYKKQSKGVNI